VTDHRVDGVPTLVLANKQDCEGAMAVEDIKQMFNRHIVDKLDVSESAVLPISALRGCVLLSFSSSLLVLTRSSRAHAGTASERRLTGSSCECTSASSSSSRAASSRR